MMLVLLTAVLLHQRAPAPAPVRSFDAGPLALELPVTWRASRQGDSFRFDASGGRAFLLIDISQVETKGLSSEECLERVLAKLPVHTQARRQVGVWPGARLESWDRSANAEQTMLTQTFFACDGKQAFSILFYLPLTELTYWRSVAERAIASLKPRAAPLGDLSETSQK
ncbi:MAG: hypothetical protein ACKVPX_16110 [Myxococcaceae bacterium]